MEILSTIANIAQVLGLRDMKSLLAIVTLTALIQAVRYLWIWMAWPTPQFSSGRSLAFWAVLFAVGLGCWIYRSMQPEPPENLVRNPRFVSGTKYWGTGYVESLATNGNFPGEVTRYAPLLLSGGAQAIGHRDATTSSPGGYASFSIEYRSQVGDNVWSSLSQLVSGLERDTDYVASFWIRAEELREKALFHTLDHRWSKLQRCYIRPGTYGWEKVECPPFNTGDRDFVDFRFVMQWTGKVWIDNVVLYKRPMPR